MNLFQHSSKGEGAEDINRKLPFRPELWTDFAIQIVAAKVKTYSMHVKGSFVLHSHSYHLPQGLQLRTAWQQITSIVN